MTVPFLPAAETIRASRAQVARDIVRSRARITDLSASLRAEVAQLSNLQLIAEVVGVTDVQIERVPDVIDAGVDPGNGEAPPAVGTPMGP